MNEMTHTPEEIARHYSSTMDSVNLILNGNVRNQSATEWADTVKRNKDHLEIMLAKDFWTTEDLTPFQNAIDFVAVQSLYMEILQFITDVGFPIGSSCLGMYFVFLTLKFLLDSVLEKIKSLIGIIKQLDTRVTGMSNDILNIDSLVSQALEIPPEKPIKKVE